MMIISLLLYSLAAFAHGPESDLNAKLIVHQRFGEVVDLSPAATAELEAYVAGVIDEARAPFEVPMPNPRIIVFRDLFSTSPMYTSPEAPEYLFVNIDHLREDHPRDVDVFLIAREMRALSFDNQTITHARAAEYERTLFGLMFRLFRLEQLDDQNEPRAALVHVPSLLHYLQGARGYRVNELDRATLITLVKSTFGGERTRRAFPEAPTPRSGLTRALAEIAQISDPTPPPRAEDRPKRPTLADALDGTLERVRGAIGRVTKDYVAALESLNTRAQAAHKISRESAIEYVGTMRAFQKSLALSRRARLAAVQFERAARIPNVFFSNWTHAVSAHKLTPTYLTFGEFFRLEGILDPSPALVNADSSVAEAATRAMLLNDDFNLDLPFVVMSVSRLMRDANARDSIDFAGRPLTSLLLSGFLARADHEVRTPVRPRTLSTFVGKHGAALARPIDGPRVAEQILAMLEDAPPPAYLERNLITLFEAVKLDRRAPGLRTTLLERLPLDGRFARLRFALERRPDRPAFARELRAKDPADFLRWLGRLATNEPANVRRWRLAEVWWEFLRTARSPADLNALIDMKFLLVDRLFALKTPLPIDDFKHVLEFERRRDAMPAVVEAGALITDIVLARGPDFVRELSARLEHDSAVLVLTDWTRVFAALDDRQILRVMGKSAGFARGAPSFHAWRTALVARVAKSIADGALLNDLQVQSVHEVLNLATVATPAGQDLVAVVIKRLAADVGPRGAERYLRFLQTVNPVNFRDGGAFADAYADALQRYIAPGGDFAILPRFKVAPELHDVRDRFDPQVAARILDRLARAYHADPTDREMFSITASHLNPPSIDFVPPARVWEFIVAPLHPGHRAALGEALRTAKPIRADVLPLLQYGFHSGGLEVALPEVERETRRWFNRLSRLRRQDQLAELQAWADKPRFRITSREELSTLRALEQQSRADQDTRDLGAAWTEQTRGVTGDGDAILEAQRQRVYRNVDEFHLWQEVAQNLTKFKTLNLVSTLRADVALDPDLRGELQLRLSKAGVIVPLEGVEGYVRARFAELTSLQRAAVVHLLLDRGDDSGVLDDPTFRFSIYRSIARSLPDATSRSIFLDVWTAGLKNLPRDLHSMILALSLAESGQVGSPETALVAILSQMGPLEQKFGQALAFADLPESYRTELRTLWNSAQSIDWWKSWDLLLRQKGDVRRAGYHLSRVLNSGSTTAYLEITHETTGHRLVVPVYREGIAQAIKVGAAQLRGFAADLVAMNRRRYGFLPLLVEDSIRTIALEIDPEHKVRMNAAMKAAYRRAGERVGWTITPEGFVLSGEFTLRGIEERDVTLDDGTVVRAQELADGLPLQDLKIQDPETYRRAVIAILALERAALRDLHAPIDKDRMPGQYIYSPSTKTIFMLDPGQARPVSMEVHARLPEFVRHGFTGDVKHVNEMVRTLTGLEPEVRASRVRDAELSLRPLVYLNEIAAPYLARPEGDPHRERFFDLVQGTRAHLRLLQWEQDEGLTAYADEIKADIRAQNGAWRLALDAVRRGFARAWRTVVDWVRTFGNSERLMEAAYATDGTLRGGPAGLCDRLLRPTAYRVNHWVDTREWF